MEICIETKHFVSFKFTEKLQNGFMGVNAQKYTKFDN